MKISGILPYTSGRFNNTPAFLGTKYSLSIKPDVTGEEYKRQQAELDKEANQAERARQRGVNVPKYKIKKDEDSEHVKQIRYETAGDIPDVNNNPIRHKHFKNLFKNLYYLDRAGIFHNDLDKSHVFFQDDGNVEIDCFRYSLNFYKGYNNLKGNDGSIRTPEFMFPSNEDTFKEHCLGEYVGKLNEDRRYDFVKDYLEQRSNYHARRGDLLVNRGFHLNNKAVQYEDIQAEVFLHPSNQVVNYEIKKLDNYALKREAFTEWDEGGGACGHKISPERRFNAILLNLECLEDAIDMRNEAEYLSRCAESKAERKYFEFETECAKKRVDNLYNDTKGMGEWNFNDFNSGIYLGSQDEKEFFTFLFDEVNPNDIFPDIREIKEFYTALAKRWNPELNSNYKTEFEAR